MTKKGYKCFDSPTNKFFVSADVIFFEFTTYFSKSSESFGEDFRCHPRSVPTSQTNDSSQVQEMLKEEIVGYINTKVENNDS